MPTQKNNPILLFGIDNGSFTLYNLTLAQYEKLAEAEDYDTIEKFEIKTNTGDCGYIPAEIVKLAEIYGFDVESN